MGNARSKLELEGADSPATSHQLSEKSILERGSRRSSRVPPNLAALKMMFNEKTELQREEVKSARSLKSPGWRSSRRWSRNPQSPTQSESEAKIDETAAAAATDKPLPEEPTLQITPAVKVSKEYMEPWSHVPMSAYFWGEEDWNEFKKILPRHSGNVEAAELIGDGSYERFEALVHEALETLERIYDTIGKADTPGLVGLVDLTPSIELQEWRKEQHALGRVLPAKGFGLKRTSDEVIRLLGAENWPAPLLTNNTVYGPGWANFSIGAYDDKVLYSNYCSDLGFYYEHGFHKVFPEYRDVFHKAGNADPYSLATFAGPERRMTSELGCRYIRQKVALEVKHLANLTGKSARMTRRDAQVLSFSESSIIGMAGESIARGFDPAAALAELVFSNPGTDVVDVGSDLGNSEVMNSFLNTADVTDAGVVTEDILRRVYDAWAYTCARILTQRWTTPVAIMCAQLYTWHMVDDRHAFLRRAVLGYAKARKGVQPGGIREGDTDEVFDERFHTTGFSRPLENACDGADTCDQVVKVIAYHPTASELLGQLWFYFVTAPLAYIRAGQPDEDREQELMEKVRVTMARCYHDGLIHEMNWLLCHASHHAWQVNFTMEAAMWGSFLDAGSLVGKLDRAD